MAKAKSEKENLKKPADKDGLIKSLLAENSEKIEKALFMRAVGYDYEESERVEEESASGVKTRTKVAKKHMAPNIQAQMFWLKSKYPDKWTDKKCQADEEDEISVFAELLEEVREIE